MLVLFIIVSLDFESCCFRELGVTCLDLCDLLECRHCLIEFTDILLYSLVCIRLSNRIEIELSCNCTVLLVYNNFIN